jgi:hypothetical protein
LNTRYDPWTPAELALLRAVRSVEHPLRWLDLQREYFPNRTVESCKLACSKHHPDLVGKAAQGRPKGSRRRLGGPPVPLNCEISTKKFEEMSVRGTMMLGAAVAKLAARYRDAA